MAPKTVEFFANKLFQQQLQDVGLMGFLPEDIQRTIKRAARKHCFVCGESGATITCREKGCNRSFHLPCAAEGGCVTQYLLQYRSFCWEHRPEQAVEAAPEEDTVCLICLDLVGDRKSYGTMVCPACKHAWFHRGCIQNQAIHAGFSSFCCPHCQNEYRFLMEMLTVGIRIPKRLPSWENSQAYAALRERHSRCDARECLCPGGREQAEAEGPWQLLLCRSCAAEGTHRGCSYLRNSTASWECDSCAGLGTASSASSELAGPSTASQSGSGPSHGSPAPETSSPSTASQAPSGTSHNSLALETSNAALGPSHGSLPPETSSPGNAASGLTRGSPVLEGSSRSSPPGPDRTRDRSQLKRRAPSPNVRPRRRPKSSCAPAPSAESGTPSQAALGLSHTLLLPETSSPSTASQLPSGSSCGSPALQSGSRSIRPGPERVQDRSQLKRRAPSPNGRPRRCRKSSCAPAPSAESSTPSQESLEPSHSSPAPETSSPSTASQLPSGSSCGSPALRSGSRSVRPGPERVRDRSRLQRRAQTPYSRPGRRHGTSREPSPSAGPDPPPPAQ